VDAGELAVWRTQKESVAHNRPTDENPAKVKPNLVQAHIPRFRRGKGR